MIDNEELEVGRDGRHSGMHRPEPPSKRADLSREDVNKIEAGRYDPPLSTITALAKSLGVKPARLLNRRRQRCPVSHHARVDQPRADRSARQARRGRT